MSRSFTFLRQGLFGIAILGSLGFGATSAVAKPEEPQRIICPPGREPCDCGDRQYCAHFNEPCCL